MIYNVENAGTGLNSDLSPEELGAGVWSSTSNVRFKNGYAERFRGIQQIFDSPSVTPYYLAAYATASKRYFIHAGLNTVFADDGTTRTNITGTAPTGSVDDRYSGGVLNGVFVLNNGVDDPMYWAGTGTLTTLPGWDTSWKAASIRPFKNFLVALDITKGSDRYPHMVKVSDIATPGAVPASWDETDPALDCYESDLAETTDLMVDCLPLGDVNIIYKERSMYAMTYVGAPYIWKFQRIPGDVGMLARGCGAVTPLGHVVLTAGDVVLNTGQGVGSIANGAVRNLIFRNIDSSNYKRAFVTTNPQQNEVWICFPYGTSETCNKACVWNWIDKTWSIRELENATYGAVGQIDYSASGSTWATWSGTWADDSNSWNNDEYSPAEARLLMCHTTPVISIIDNGATDFGVSVAGTIERSGMTLDDPMAIKTIKSVYPKIDGVYGSTVYVQVGAAMLPDSAPIWKPAVPFIVGQSLKADTFCTGRYMSIRFFDNEFSPWRMKSFSIDFKPSGKF